VWHKFNVNPGIRPGGLRKTKQNLSQDKRYPARDLNPRLPGYEAGLLITDQNVRYTEYRTRKDTMFGTAYAAGNIRKK
jgi:hypothetical protein